MAIVLLNQTPTQTQLAGALIERYQALVLAQKPVAYWPMNEATGTSVLDLSGHGNTGTIQGGVTLGQPGPIVGDPADTAMGFNYSEYIAIPSSLNSDLLTVAAWVNFDSGYGGNPRVIANQHTDATNVGFELVLGFNVSNGFGFVVGNGSGYASCLTNSTSPGAWHFVVGTYNGTTTAIYLDGVLQSTSTSISGPIAASTYPVNIGRDVEYQGDYYGGLLAQVAIFPTALDAAIIQQLYLAGKTAITGWDPAGNLYTGEVVEGSYTTTVLADAPVAYWPLAVARNGTTPDLSGNNHVGTVSSSGVATNVNGPFNKMGDSATSFLGTNGYVLVPTLVPNGASLSIECWVRLRSIQGCLVAMATSPNWTEAQTAVYCVSNGWIGGNTDSSLPGGLDVFTPTLDTWYHVVFVYEANVGSGIYVDGEGSLSNGTLGNSEDDLYVTIGAGNMNGWYNNTGWYLDGDLAHVAIYDYALSPAQVLAHYQASQGTFRRDMTSTRKVYVPSLVEAGSYTNTVLSLDPAAYWPLGVARNGTTPDLSGNRNVGTLSPSGITSNVNGPFNRMGDAAMAFNGSSGYISVPPTQLNVASDGTFSLLAWIYLNGSTSKDASGGQYNYGTIIESSNNGGTLGFNLVINDAQKIWWWPSSGNDRFSTNIVPLQAWALIGIVWTPTTVTMYINGLLDSTQSNYGQGPAGILQLAAQSWVGGALCGSLAQVAIFPYALSAAQVALLYNAGQGQFLDSTIPA